MCFYDIDTLNLFHFKRNNNSEIIITIFDVKLKLLLLQKTLKTFFNLKNPTAQLYPTVISKVKFLNVICV